MTLLRHLAYMFRKLYRTGTCWLIPRSLFYRLLCATLLGTSLVLLAIGIYLYASFQGFIHQQWQASLQLPLDQLTSRIDFNAQSTPYLESPLGDPRFNHAYSGWYWQIIDGNSRVVQRSRSLWDQVLQPDMRQAAQMPSGSVFALGITARANEPLLGLARWVYSLEQPQQRFLLVVAADATDMQQALQSVLYTMLWGYVLLVCGLLGVLILQIRLGLRPVKQLQHAIQDIHKGKERSIIGQYPPELLPLVEAFHQVLEHDTQVLVRARTQAGNLAHALKTRLSVIIHAASQENTVIAQTIRDQAEETQQLIQYHLAQTRAAAASQIPGQFVEVVPIVEKIVRAMQKLYPDHRVIWTSAADEELLFKGESQDFYEMIGNLLENACKWAQHQIKIEIRQSTSHKGYLECAVHDDGPGIPAADHERVLQRGIRADTEQPGSGIGLAIVFELVRLYHGHITLRTSPLGGLHITCALPLFTK